MDFNVEVKVEPEVTHDTSQNLNVEVKIERVEDVHENRTMTYHQNSQSGINTTSEKAESIESIFLKKSSTIKTFSCNLCPKIYSKKKSIERHERIHKYGKRFSCPMCPRQFTEKWNLNIHLRIHYKLKYVCKLCDKSLADYSGFRKHIRRHSTALNSKARRFYCEDCGKSYKAKKDLIRHVQAHSEDIRFQCHLCSKSYRRKNKLNMHVQRHHHGDPNTYTVTKHNEELEDTVSIENKARKIKKKKAKDQKENKPENLSCKLCDKVFSWKQNLKRHMKVHDTGKQFSCHLCPKTFIASWNLNQHLRVHNNLTYECEICGKNIRDHSRYNKHVREHGAPKVKKIRIGTEKFICDICEKSYLDKRNLIRHVQGHYEENRHKCRLCDKSYMRSDKLYKHLKSHLIEKPFSCGVCGKKYSEKLAAERHEKRCIRNLKAS